MRSETVNKRLGLEKRGIAGTSRRVLELPMPMPTLAIVQVDRFIGGADQPANPEVSSGNLKLLLLGRSQQPTVPSPLHLLEPVPHRFLFVALPARQQHGPL